MNRRQLTGLLILCLLMTALAGWWMLNTDDPAQLGSNHSAVTNHANDNSSVSQPEIGSNKDASKPIPPSPLNHDTSSNSTSKPDTPAAKTIPKGHWRLTGQLVAAFEVNHSALKDMDFKECNFSMETLPANDGETPSEWTDDIELAPDGRFSIDIAEEELTSISGAWRFDFSVEQEGHPLEGWGGGFDFSEWENEDGIVDLAAVHNLVKPAVSGRQADFGKIKIDVRSIDPNALFIAGRVMHTSGVPFANAVNLMLRAYVPAPEEDNVIITSYEEVAWFGTGKDGYFFGVAENPEQFKTVTRNKYSLITGEEFDYEYEDNAAENSLWVHSANTPTKRGRVWDFGIITVAGNLVEIDIKGIRDNLEVYDVYIEFSSGNMWKETEISLAGGSILMLAARYRWTCSISSPDALFDDASGVLDVRSGTNTKLTVEFAEVPTVKVTVKLNSQKGAGKKYSRFWIEYERHGGNLYRYNYDHNQTILVPVRENHLELRIGGKGYITQELSIQHNSPPVNIALLSIEQIAVTVHLPYLPSGFREPTMGVSVKVYREQDSGWPTVYNSKLQAFIQPKEFSKNATESIYLLETGNYRFVLTGGAKWGYAQLGQKELEVTSGDGNVVVFDSIPEVPWEFHSGGLTTKAYVANRVVNITAKARNKDGKSLTVNIDSDNANSSTLQIDLLPIIDGTQLIKPVETPPAKDDDVAHIRVDLPHRISVTCSERGQRVSVFKVEAGLDIGHERCSSKVQKGTGKLWLPPGKAWISVEFNNRYERRELEVHSGRVININVDFVGCKVTFTGKQDDVDDQWSLFLVKKNGSLDSIGWAVPNDSKYLQRGKYAVVAPDGQSRRGFEITASDEDIEVELPERSAKLRKGDLLLNLDMPTGASKGELGFTINWTPITGDPKLDQSLNRESFELSVIETPDGLLLKDVPLGTKICIFGGIDTWSDDQDKSWLLRPIIVNLPRSGETQTTTLETVIEEGEDWWDYDPRILSYADGLPIDSWFGLPVGRHKFGFYSEGILVLSEWITIPDQKEAFDLPESIQTKLDALITED